MSLLTGLISFTNGTGPANIIDATQMNSNFTAVATAVNNIYPSQVLPITTAQATFGATAVGVGYKFLANDATATPLTISGVTSQSVDIFDVTLTSGGTKAFFVSATGVVTVPGTGGLVLGSSGANTSAKIFNTGGFSDFGTTAGTAGGVTGGGFFLDNGVSNTLALSTIGDFGVARSVFAGGGNAPNAGSLVSAVSTTSGQVIFGGTFASATGAGAVTFDGSKYNFFSAGLGGSTANIVAATGVYNATSDERLKKDIVVIPYGLAEVLKMKPSKFKWVLSDQPGLGFIAQDVAAVLPDLVSTDSEGLMGVNYDGIIPVLVKAFQELNAAYTAYIAAHP